jgi:hypothetical protein
MNFPAPPDRDRQRPTPKRSDQPPDHTIKLGSPRLRQRLDLASLTSDSLTLIESLLHVASTRPHRRPSHVRASGAESITLSRELPQHPAGTSTRTSTARSQLADAHHALIASVHVRDSTRSSSLALSRPLALTRLITTCVHSVSACQLARAFTLARLSASSPSHALAAPGRQLAHAFTLAHPRPSPPRIERRRIARMQARSRPASVNQRLQTLASRLLSFNENASLHGTPEVSPLARIIIFPSTQVLP